MKHSHDLGALLKASFQGTGRFSRIGLGAPAVRPEARVTGLTTRIDLANPEAVALRANGQEMSYGELNARADRLAGYLRSLDLEPQFLAGICLERSLDQVVSTLAVWKAGGAFLPLDPAWPRQRKQTILQDAKCAVLIGVLGTVDDLSGSRPLVALDRDVRLIEGAAICPPAPTSSPDSLAYVIYTSGSAGRPKGVEITHGALANLVAWHCETFGVTASDRASHLAGIGFDAAIWEIWPYLSVGASVSLVTDHVRTSASLLRDWLIEQEITIAFAPTILAETMLALAWPAHIPLRYLLTGADTLHAFPRPGMPFALVNNYGPTECTVVATSAIIAPSGELAPPIGRPIANTQIHLLDDLGRPVPPGTVGEIYIGGAGVGRGYRNDPDLTAARFIVDGFSRRPGARLYRTGDLGALRPDGQILFKGRTDAQQKIRGHRFDPDEVAAVINRHPLVQSCAVAARAMEGGDRRLVAYLVLEPTCVDAPSSEDMRRFAAEHLPEYMIPASFVRLEALPSTHNGKLDRTALPDPDDGATLDRVAYRAPQTPIERRLVEIFAEVLNRDGADVGVDDNFFLMGGHSLLGAQLTLRAGAAFGVELKLLDLFQSQTITALATVIGRLILERLESMSEDEAQALVAD